MYDVRAKKIRPRANCVFQFRPNEASPFHVIPEWRTKEGYENAHPSVDPSLINFTDEEVQAILKSGQDHQPSDDNSSDDIPIDEASDDDNTATIVADEIGATDMSNGVRITDSKGTGHHRTYV